MTRWIALSFVLPSTVDNSRITRRVPVSASHTWYVVRLRDPSDVDDQVRAWLTESYLSSPE